MVKSYRDLVLWGVAVDFIKEVYRLTKVFPQDEKYGLVQQMRRAAVSIVSNLAEGSARKNTKELIQFLYISLGSLAEVEAQLFLAQELGFIDDIVAIQEKTERLRALILGLLRALKKRVA